MAGKARRLRRGERELTGEVWQRLQRSPHALVDHGAGLRGQLGALLDQRKRGLGPQFAGAQQSRRLVKPSAQLEQRISHAHKVIDPSARPARMARGRTSLRLTA
jgi:hypothetical protein